jgi:flagellar protein FlaF
MPVGELIAAAVGLILLIIVAYVLVGSTIGTAETMASAQRDMTHLQEIRLHTDITIMSATGIISGTTETVNFVVANNGSVAINNFRNMTVFIGDYNGNAPVLYPSESDNWDSGGTSPDRFPHPGSFNPRDILNGRVTNDTSNQPICSPGASYWIEVVTVNGVTSSAPITFS